MKIFCVNRFISILSILFVLSTVEMCLRWGVIGNRHYNHLLSQGHKDKPSKKLLILGDSFFDKRSWLGKMFVEQLEPLKVNILNLAISGMGPLQYLWELEAYGKSFKPDIILLSYYIGNDLTDVQYKVENATGFKKKIKSYFRPVIRKLYLYHFYKKRMEIINLKRFDYKRMMDSGVDEGLVELAKDLKINPSLLDIGIRKPNYLLDNVMMETNANMKAWKTIEEILKQIHAISIKLNAELVMIIFPRSIQINDTHFEFFTKLKFNMDRRTLKSNKPQTLFMKFCEYNNIRCLDLLPYFKARKNEEFYLTNDDHLNREGDELASRLIREFL